MKKCGLMRKPVNSISLNWEMLQPNWKYASKDSRNQIYVYEEEPSVGMEHWKSGGDFARLDTLLCTVDPGTVDWKDSLIRRPSSS